MLKFRFLNQSHEKLFVFLIPMINFSYIWANDIYEYRIESQSANDSRNSERLC